MAFPWLPLETPLPDGAASARLLRSGPGWQLLATSEPSRTVLLADPAAADQPPWWPSQVEALRRALDAATIPGECGPLLAVLAPADASPVTLDALALRSSSPGPDDLEALIVAIEATPVPPGAAWGSAVLVPHGPALLFTADAIEEDRAAVLTAVLSGGVRDTAWTPARISALNRRLTEGEVAAAMRRLGLHSSPRSVGRCSGPPAAFTLPGQPRVERLLRERVVDVAHRPAEYAALGVGLPNGILLAGPPGSGKSFAARRLAMFLGWPLHELNAASVGSSLLHETARGITRVFADAAAQAPAILLLEEADAIGGARDRTHAAGVEEVNALLRELETAAARGVLVVATTNRVAALDPALLRRGRFDLVCDMAYPDAEATQAMLEALLAGRPCAPGVNAAAFAARLAGRPASDVAALVEEAGWHAVRTGKQAIDDVALAAAAREVLSRADSGDVGSLFRRDVGR